MSTLPLLARTATVAAVALLYLPGVQAAPTAGLTSGAGEGAQGKHEKHPHIRAALHELREATRELKEAAHDFGGHREEALKASEGAIEQLKICLEAVAKKGGAGKGAHKDKKTGEYANIIKKLAVVR